MATPINFDKEIAEMKEKEDKFDKMYPLNKYSTKQLKEELQRRKKRR